MKTVTSGDLFAAVQQDAAGLGMPPVPHTKLARRLKVLVTEAVVPRRVGLRSYGRGGAVGLYPEQALGRFLHALRMRRAGLRRFGQLRSGLLERDLYSDPLMVLSGTDLYALQHDDIDEYGHELRRVRTPEPLQLPSRRRRGDHMDAAIDPNLAWKPAPLLRAALRYIGEECFEQDADAAGTLPGAPPRGLLVRPGRKQHNPVQRQLRQVPLDGVELAARLSAWGAPVSLALWGLRVGPDTTERLIAIGRARGAGEALAYALEESGATQRFWGRLVYGLVAALYEQLHPSDTLRGIQASGVDWDRSTPVTWDDAVAVLRLVAEVAALLGAPPNVVAASLPAAALAPAPPSGEGATMVTDV